MATAVLSQPPVIVLLCGLLGAAGAWIVSRWGGVMGLTDVPNHRSSHTVPTPKGGGVGLLAAFGLAAAAGGLPIVFWLPAVLVSLAGLFGDRVDLSPRKRLLIQFAAAAVLVLGTGAHAPNLKWGSLVVPFWLVFIVGTANFFNFMDGINGISGITAAIGFGFVTVYLIHATASAALIVTAAGLCAAAVGFLPFNLPRARVFMGDVGSTLLGFVFAALVYAATDTLQDFLCLTAFVLPYFLDELFTMAVRIRDGEHLMKAHRRHVYQLLANEGGIAHWQVAVGYGLFQLLAGGGILAVSRLGAPAVAAVLTTVTLAFAAFSTAIRRRLEK
jgi:Fuc2NAc and GlcNAc transferase